MGDMSQHLLFRVDTEYDSLVVAIEWTPKVVAEIEHYRKAVTALATATDGLHRAFFWYGVDVYALTDDLEELLEEDGQPVLVDDPPLDESGLQRTEVNRMGVDKEDVIFKFYLKHTNNELETSTVRFDNEEFFPKTS